MLWGWCEKKQGSLAFAGEYFSCGPFCKTLFRNEIKTDISILDLFPWVKPMPSLAMPALGENQSSSEAHSLPRRALCCAQGTALVSIRGLSAGLIALEWVFQAQTHLGGPPLLESFHSSSVEVPSSCLWHCGGFTLMGNGSPEAKLWGWETRQVTSSF